MKKILSGLVVLSVVLSACSSEQEKIKTKASSEQSEKKDETSKKTESKTTETASKQEDSTEKLTTEEVTTEVTSEEKNTTETVESEDAIDEKTKLALAFLHEDAEKYIISGKEILTGTFKLQLPPEPQLKKFHRLILSPVTDSTVPEGVKVYQVYPGKSNFISFIAFTDTETIIGGTQNGYRDILKSNNLIKYNTQEMYDQKKNLSSLKELSNIVEIGNQPEYNAFAQEETMTNQTARERFYNEIMAMEGTNELDPQYVWDDIKLDGNNEFYVNYRNQDLEILGTYKIVNGKMVKEEIK
ncbi:hypothetical protein ACMGE6_02155 [Macrococcus equi]|uniref:hypothetical protein n=1 Tax=Macrococcus equi TaxID=3395462 RepID=UPI0039BDBF55